MRQTSGQDASIIQFRISAIETLKWGREREKERKREREKKKRVEPVGNHRHWNNPHDSMARLHGLIVYGFRVLQISSARYQFKKAIDNSSIWDIAAAINQPSQMLAHTKQHSQHQRTQRLLKRTKRSGKTHKLIPTLLSITRFCPSFLLLTKRSYKQYLVSRRLDIFCCFCCCRCCCCCCCWCCYQ